MKERYRLHSMPNAHCMVEISYNGTFDEYRVYLISYSTTVLECVIDRYGANAELNCSGLYSATTRRHINRFTTEFFGRNLYYMIKENIKAENKFTHGKSKWFYIGDFLFDWEVLKKYQSGDYAPRYYGHY